MDISVFTADFAQTDDRGKINAIGLGWSVIPTPLPLHGVAVLFLVDWSETDVQHEFEVTLVDADGRPVVVDGAPIIHVQGQFTLGRPEAAAPGTRLSQAIAVNFPQGLQLAPGRYEYRATCGEDVGAAGFAVVPAS